MREPAKDDKGGSGMFPPESAKGSPPLGGTRTGLSPAPDKIQGDSEEDVTSWARVLASTAGIEPDDVDRAVSDFPGNT